MCYAADPGPWKFLKMKSNYLNCTVSLHNLHLCCVRKGRTLNLLIYSNFNKLRNKLHRKIPLITEFIYWKWLTGRNNEYSTEQLLLCVSSFLKFVQLTPTGAYPIWSILETVYDHVVAKSGRPIGIYINFFYKNIFPLPYTIFV